MFRKYVEEFEKFSQKNVWNLWNLTRKLEAMRKLLLQWKQKGIFDEKKTEIKYIWLSFSFMIF